MHVLCIYSHWNHFWLERLISHWNIHFWHRSKSCPTLHVSGFPYLLESGRLGAFMYTPIFSVSLPTRTSCWQVLYEWKTDLDCHWLKKLTNTRWHTRATQYYYLSVAIWAVQCMYFMWVTFTDVDCCVPAFTGTRGAKKIRLCVWKRPQRTYISPRSISATAVSPKLSHPHGLQHPQPHTHTLTHPYTLTRLAIYS